ncbi:methionyl-tRNA formyltransferase [Candidatus Saccharibacteria bacterium]|nr:methionyl-tRNA formyltransferase [Candidatus Saccharibacteria bacterium]
MKKIKIIFFGNGPLSEYALAALERDYTDYEVIFHAHTREDLSEAVRLKQENPDAHGVLASFGVLIPSSVLEVFEPEGILNIHPSLLPLYRGASPIESAILAGDTTFGVSVMKLVKAMDAGPIYSYATFEDAPIRDGLKDLLYKTAAEVGISLVFSVLTAKKPVVPKPQDDSKATYCGKLDKNMSVLTPETDTTEQTFRKILAFAGFPKAKYEFYGVKCIILEAHICDKGETALLAIPCADGVSIAVDRLQPEGRKVMDAKSFINGYKK